MAQDSDLLTMCRKTVFVRKDRDGVHREFMSCAEDTDGDFLMRNASSKMRHIAEMYGERTPRLATRIFVKGPE